jgi:protein TonB
MFKTFAPGARRRRVWSPGTIAASVAAHAFLLGGAAYATLHASPPTRETASIFDIGEPPAPPPPVKPQDPPPPPPAPDEPAARAGQTVEIPAPTDVPTELPKVNPNEAPLHDYQVTGIGTTGTTYDPNATTQAPTGPTTTAGEGPEVIAVEDLGEMPALANRNEVQRVLQRTYPSNLRDAGIAGEARLQFIINTDGTVDAASVQVVSSTQEAFGDAARRAVEKFRFRPATMMGEPVRVLITIPIRFTVNPSD